MTILKASDYPKFRSIPRLHRNVVLSEKLDGTNGLIEITEVANFDDSEQDITLGVLTLGADETQYIVRAGSRNRWLTVENDNFGFAKWVFDNAEALTALGEGRHYGEWFGKGIQSGYGIDEKRFALFNTARWYDPRNPGDVGLYLRTFPKAERVPFVTTVVPVLLVTDGQNLNAAVTDALHTLERGGSVIAPGFMDPEGVVAYHMASGAYFKTTIKNDEVPKGKVTK